MDLETRARIRFAQWHISMGIAAMNEENANKLIKNKSLIKQISANAYLGLVYETIVFNKLQRPYAKKR